VTLLGVALTPAWRHSEKTKPGALELAVVDERADIPRFQADVVEQPGERNGDIFSLSRLQAAIGEGLNGV